MLLMVSCTVGGGDPEMGLIRTGARATSLPSHHQEMVIKVALMEREDLQKILLYNNQSQNKSAASSNPNNLQVLTLKECQRMPVIGV